MTEIPFAKRRQVMPWPGPIARSLCYIACVVSVVFGGSQASAQNPQAVTMSASDYAVLMSAVGSGGPVDLQDLLSRADPDQIHSVTDAEGHTFHADDPDFMHVFERLTGNREPVKTGIFSHMSQFVLIVSTVTSDYSHTMTTLRFINASYDSLPLDIVVQSVSPTHPTSGGAPASLAGWMRDIPTGVVLAPRAIYEVALPIELPAGAAPGTYTADVIVYDKPTITVDVSADLSGDAIPRFFADTTAAGFPRATALRTRIVCQVRKNDRRSHTTPKILMCHNASASDGVTQ